MAAFHFQFLKSHVSKHLGLFKAARCYLSSNPPFKLHTENALQPFAESLGRKVAVNLAPSEGTVPSELQGSRAGRAGKLQSLIWENDFGCRTG